MILLALGLVLLLPLRAGSQVKTSECLDCHEGYKGYSHGSKSCTDCHSTITSLPHPNSLPRPSCAECHQQVVYLYDQSVHNEKGMACKECHNVHFLQKDKKRCGSCHGNVSHRTLPSSAKHLDHLACIACHGKPVSAQMTVRVVTKGKGAVDPRTIDRNGDQFIDRDEWTSFQGLPRSESKGKFSVEKSYRVEGNMHLITVKPVKCEACHSAKGFFSHARLRFFGKTVTELPIDASIFIPQLPVSAIFAQTVHGRSGVKCADCHTSQKEIAQDRSESDAVCAKCHKEVEDVYNNSAHGTQGVAHCVDCHNPHRIRSYRELDAEERLAVCARCHKDYLSRHSWLPNTSLHFEYLECATCHSPSSRKSMVFYFARRKQGRKVPLRYDELSVFVGPGADLRNMFGSGRGISVDTQIGQLFINLKKQEPRLLIDAAILVTKVYHDYSITRLEEKKCVICHSRDAHFYESMYFILPQKEGPEYIRIRGTLLSAYPLSTFLNISLLGEDKISKRDIDAFLRLKGTAKIDQARALGFKWIDFFGITLIAIILIGVCIHIILRIISRIAVRR